MVHDTKRLFFGARISAPWPSDLPKGRILPEESRHLTLAFLGDTPYHSLIEILTSFPEFPSKVGIVGTSDRLLLLPEKSPHPHVAAYHVHWLEYDERLRTFQQNLINWLHSHHFKVETHQDFLSHVTIARSPFISQEWKEFYCDLPFIITSIHLYESLGQLRYSPIWNLPLIPPFEELEHTADIAFRIYAEKPSDLHLHAQIALAFKFPSLLPFLFLDSLKQDLDDMIISLNESVSRADASIGSPIKAVSFHGSIHLTAQGLLTWEMIIDV